MTSINELQEEYETLFQREKQIDEELNQLLSNQITNESKFNSIKSIFPNIQLIYKDSINLSNMINFTANLADNVSSKVRQLDLAKGRVTSCVKRVTDILDLKACTDGVTEALSEEDYETAANHIHRYLSLDKDSLRLKTLNADLNEKNYLDQSFNVLQESKNKLQKIVNEKYDHALNTNDVPQLERFFKIFPLIGQSEDGLVKFSFYLCRQINQAADQNFLLISNTDKTEKRWNIMFADALILLFEKVARVIEAYQPVIETYYGHGNMFLFIKNIQKECDLQAIKILDKFKETRNLNRIFKIVQQSNLNNYSRNTAASSSLMMNSMSVGNNLSKLEEKIDPRDLDELLIELTMISARTELFKNFLLKSIITDLNGDKVMSQLPTAHILMKSKLNEAETFINSCDLRCCIQELICQYSVLENYFMTENMYKAMQMDTILKDSLTSSVVDDVFYILKKCIKRCLCSDSVDGCCAMFNNCSSALDSIYKDFFFNKLKAGYSSGFDLSQAYTAIQRRFQHTDQNEKQKLQFLIALNNIEESIDNISSIRKSFEDDISKLFVQESQSSKDKLNSCLNDLNAVSNRFKELLDFGFNQLFSNDIKPRIKQACDLYPTFNHKINEDELNQYATVDPFIQNFIKGIDQMLAFFKDHLSTKNQDILAGLLASEIANNFEKNIFKCLFTKFGGLQLDKELRILINYLTSLTSWSIREKFSRLTQISILLSLENLNELFEYWNSPLAITWRLTPNEIRSALLLRADFKSEEVKSLKL